MARTDTLGHFLTDVADAIREKTGSSEEIVASDFDTEIENIPSGGGADLSEYFNTTIDSNTAGTLTERANLIKKFPDVIIGDNVTNISNAFADFYFGTSLPKLIGGTNLTNISALFSSASYNKAIVTQIDISGLITNKVSNMSYMFNGQSVITNLDFSNFNTENVTNMSSMFSNSRSLTSLNLSNFNTSKVTNMVVMFAYCTNLTNLDIRNFDFTTVTSSTNMFLSVPNDCLIIVKDDTAKTWITSKFSNLTNVKTVAEYEAE